MPKTHVGVSGAEREVKKIVAGVSGVNRECKEAWAGVNGVNRLVYSSFPYTVSIYTADGSGTTNPSKVSIDSSGTFTGTIGGYDGKQKDCRLRVEFADDSHRVNVGDEIAVVTATFDDFRVENIRFNMYTVLENGNRAQVLVTYGSPELSTATKTIRFVAGQSNFPIAFELSLWRSGTSSISPSVTVRNFGLKVYGHTIDFLS